MNLFDFFIFLGGVLGGGALTWLLMNSKLSAAASLATASMQVELATAQEKARSLGEQALQWQLDLNAVRQQALQDQAKLSALSSETSSLNTLLEAERKQADEKLALLLEAREEMSNRFKALASEILEEKSKRFTEQNQSNLGQLLDPLAKDIKSFKEQVQKSYGDENEKRAALSEQVKSLMALNQALGKEASNLTSALKGSNKAQGNWGEIVLERVLEGSGLRKGHEYQVQQSHTLEDGSRLQPDVVIHLPEDRHLVVDAKASLISYEKYVIAEEDSHREAAIKQHLESIRTHIKGLSGKNYQDLYGLKSLDFVLLFVPLEPAFMLAVTHDRELFMDAWQKNVLLVSPSTLLFVVRTVAHLWRQEAQSKNAQDIANRGAILYDKFTAFATELEKVGERIRQAQQSFESARTKLTGQGALVRQAEMLKALGVKPSKTMPAVLLNDAQVTPDEEPLCPDPN
jgi:DNA recombination protein RmuC